MRRLTIEDVRARAVLTVEETADLLGLGRSSAYQAVRSGELPGVRVGRRVVVPTPALLRLLGDDSAPT